MIQELLYIKVEQNVKIQNKKVLLENIAKIYSSNSKISKELSKEVVMVVQNNENAKFTFSIMKIIELIHKRYPEIQIVNLGEKDFIVDYIVPKKRNQIFEWVKAVFVSLIIFFGSAFTIMTFNTDVRVDKVLDMTYELMMGMPKKGGSILEISYSLGLAFGIIVFFDHFSRKKTHNDPTPLQIEMRTYEESINKALIQNASREGKTIDSD